MGLCGSRLGFPSAGWGQASGGRRANRVQRPQRGPAWRRRRHSRTGPRFDYVAMAPIERRMTLRAACITSKMRIRSPGGGQSDLHCIHHSGARASRIRWHLRWGGTWIRKFERHSAMRASANGRFGIALRRSGGRHVRRVQRRQNRRQNNRRPLHRLIATCENCARRSERRPGSGFPGRLGRPWLVRVIP